MRHLVARQVQGLLADHLPDTLDERQVGVLIAREERRPSGRSSTRSSRSSSIPSRTFALTGWSAWKSPSVAAAFICDGDVPVLEAVDLVERDHDRDAERKDAACDEAVAGTDALARGEHEQHRVDVLEGAVDGLLHPLGQRVHGPLEARQVGEHELPVGRRSRRRRSGGGSCWERST